MKQLLSTAVITTFTVFLLGLTVSHDALAAKRKPRRFPNGCRQLGFQFEGRLLTLVPAREELPNPQTLYFLHNTSGRSIHIKAEKSTDQPFTPSYENYIGVNRWAAFAMDLKTVAFTCNTGRGEVINCGDTLELCQYNNVKFSDSNGGNYWVVKSLPRYGAIHKAINIGILLRW